MRKHNLINCISVIKDFMWIGFWVKNIVKCMYGLVCFKNIAVKTRGKNAVGQVVGVN